MSLSPPSARKLPLRLLRRTLPPAADPLCRTPCTRPHARGLATQLPDGPRMRMRKLKHHEDFERNGVEGFLSKTAYYVSWLQYQQYLLDQIQKRTDKTTDVGLNPLQLAIKHARDPEQASLFNHASMAHNNEFFWDCLGPAKFEIPLTLQREMARAAGSVPAMRDTLLHTAGAMFGPGFVWLVAERHGWQTAGHRLAAATTGTTGTAGTAGAPGTATAFAAAAAGATGATGVPGVRLSVLATYLAGSPYPSAHHRRNPEDQNTRPNHARTGEKITTMRDRLRWGGRDTEQRGDARPPAPTPDNQAWPADDPGGWMLDDADYHQSDGSGGGSSFGNGSGGGPAGGGASARDRSLPPAASGGAGLVGHAADAPGQPQVGPTGADLCPLLCVSTWEHVYMWDFGPWNKRAYLQCWWDRVDWERVERRWLNVVDNGGPVEPSMSLGRRRW